MKRPIFIIMDNICLMLSLIECHQWMHESVRYQDRCTYVTNGLTRGEKKFPIRSWKVKRRCDSRSAAAASFGGSLYVPACAAPQVMQQLGSSRTTH